MTAQPGASVCFRAFWLVLCADVADKSSFDMFTRKGYFDFVAKVAENSH